MAATLPAYSALSPPAAPPLYSREIEGEAAPGEHPPSTPGEPPSDHGQYDQPPSLLNQDHQDDPLISSALPRVQDHYILTIIMMVVCGVLLNLPAFLCLIPALSLSKKSGRAKLRGEYMEARSSAQWSLWLNMAAIISYLALMILGVGLIVAVLSSV